MNNYAGTKDLNGDCPKESRTHVIRLQSKSQEVVGSKDYATGQAFPGAQMLHSPGSAKRL